MKRPIQINFRNIATSPALEEVIADRAAWLETFYTGLIGCRVTVSVPHRHRRHGNPVHVHVEVSLPGEDVVVRHEPASPGPQGEAIHKNEEARRNHDHQDAASAIRDAFDIARRQIEDYARRQRGDVKRRTTNA